MEGRYYAGTGVEEFLFLEVGLWMFHNRGVGVTQECDDSGYTFHFRGSCAHRAQCVQERALKKEEGEVEEGERL